MQSEYRDILRHSVVYGVGQMLTRLASFLLLPLYTSYLRPADYGVIAIVDLTSAALGILIGAGMAGAVSRYHFEAKTEREQDQVWWTGVSLLACTATLVVAPLWLFRSHLAAVMLGKQVANGSYFYALALPTLWLNAFGQLPDNYLRVRKWSRLWVAVSFGTLLLNIALNVTFLVVYRLGIAGVLWGNLISNGLSVLVLWVTFLRSRGSFALSLPIMAKLWRFGAPLVGTALFAMFMQQADRYLLRLFLGLDRVGVYSLASAIGQGVNALILLPFGMVWGISIYEIAQRHDANQVYVRVFEYFVYGLALVLFGLSLFAKPLIMLMAAHDYLPAADLIPIICLAYFLYSLHAHFSVPALLAKRTTSLVPAYAAAVTTGIAANLVLIPTMGASGAAWASVASFSVFSFSGLLWYRRIDRYDYPLPRCATVIAGMAVCWFALHLLDKIDPPLLLSITFCSVVWIVWALALLGPLARTYHHRPSRLAPATELEQVRSQ